MGSINTDGSAYGFLADAPDEGGDGSPVTIRLWVKSSGSGTVVSTDNNPYLVVWFNGSTLTLYEGVESFGFYTLRTDAHGTWIHVALTHDGSVWRCYTRLESESTHTLHHSGNSVYTLTGLNLFGPDAGLGTPQLDALFCNARVSTVALTIAQLDDDCESDAAVDAGTTLWAQWANGPSPSASTWGDDASGNNNDIAQSGTALTDPDDPIEDAPGGSTETLTVTGAGSSSASGVAALALRATASGAASSASAGSAFARLTRREIVTGATSSALVGDVFARAVQRLPVTGASAAAAAGDVFARTVQRLTVTGVSSAASTGTIRTACTLHATGATCSASAGQASAVSDGSLQITGASCAVTPGQAYARLTQRFVVTGGACIATPGDASARQVTALVVTGAAAASTSGVARHALTLRAAGDSCSASGGLASVTDGFTPVTWETSEITLHVASVQAYTRTARLELDIEMQPLACASRVGALGAYVRTRNLELSYL